MALADYYLCDVCEGKAFYDAKITDPRYCATWDPSEDSEPIAIMALCTECAKTHEIIVREKGDAMMKARENNPESPDGSPPWECPINDPTCTKNCGSYGCGN